MQWDVRKTIGPEKAKDIRRSDILFILNSIKARGAYVQANRTLATVRKMFAWALENEYVDMNPAAGISKPIREKPKERFLSIDEIVQLWTSLEKYDDFQSQMIGKAFKLIVLTGCRPGEVLSLIWEQVSGSWAYIPGVQTKNNKPQRIFLSSYAKEIMGTPQRKGFVLCRYDQAQIPVYTLSAWLRGVNRLGMKDWTPHDLRRTCATHLSEAEVPPHIIQKILNHTPQGITAQVYDQYSFSREISEALESWGAKIKNAIGDKPTLKNLILFPQTFEQ